MMSQRPEIRGHLTVSSLLFTVSCILLLSFLIVACGKKGPPTLKAYEKPDTPIGLKAMQRENTIILSWSYSKKIENLNGFYVFRSTGKDFQPIAFVAGNKNSYVDKRAKTGVTYLYKVVAQSMKEILSDDSNIITVTPQTVPAAPKNVSYHTGNDSLLIKWDSAGENVLYNVYKTTEKGRYTLTPVNSEPIRATSFIDTLEVKRSVYYTVRGVINTEPTAEGTASTEIEVNPASFVPSKPEGLQTILTENKVNLIWKENPETWVMKYRIYRKTADSEEFKLIGESATPAFIDQEKAGKKHIYRVTAVGPVKESEPSKIATVDF